MKKVICIVLALILALVVCVHLSWKYNVAGFRLLGHEKAHKMTYTTGLLSSISEEIKSLVLEDGIAPPQNTESITDWLEENSDWVKIKSKSLPRFFDSATGAIVDSWGTPIVLRVHGANSYSLVSFGYNRKDDGGKGDDLVYEFDPFEYVDENCQ